MIKGLRNHSEKLRLSCEINSPDKFLQFSLQLHNIFNKNVWGINRPSYHNSQHVISTIRVLESTFASLKQGKDPFSIISTLKTWNEINHTNFTLEKLYNIMCIAFSGHDLGNICRNIHFRNNLAIPVFLGGYKSKDAEKRSKMVVEKILCYTGYFQKRQADLDLCAHLIQQTTSEIGKENSLFRMLVGVVDCVGSRLFAKTNFKQMELGLLEEMISENSRAILIDPSYFFNFPRRKICELCENNKKVISRILKTWGKVLPREKQGFSNTPIKAKYFLQV